MKVHFIGVGGAGVSALARLYAARGHRVSGCDLRASATTRALESEGVEVRIGHDAAHVAGCGRVVYSGAVKAGTAELEAARRQTEVLSRAEALAMAIASHDSIAVAGTHGKTTVTAMIGHILVEAGRDPTVLVGDGWGSRVGRTGLLVAEADESDGTLPLHHAATAVVTNLELDHTDRYDDVEQLVGEFEAFLNGDVGGAAAVVCADDPVAAALRTGRTRFSYGFDLAADYRCEHGRPFILHHKGVRLGEVELALPGRHNTQNACAAAAVALERGVDFQVVSRALGSFKGARRRLERLGSWRGAVLYDDYGHHPTEVRATLDAARELPHRRLILVFQPHRYSRWAFFRADFAAAFRAADEVILTEIYPAGENNPDGLTAAGLAGTRFAPDFAAAREMLEGVAGEGDLVLLMGAGDIRRLGDELAG